MEQEYSKYICYFEFPILDFLIHKIKEREFQKFFSHPLPYFYTTYPAMSICGKNVEAIFFFGKSCKSYMISHQVQYIMNDVCEVTVQRASFIHEGL